MDEIKQPISLGVDSTSPMSLEVCIICHVPLTSLKDGSGTGEKKQLPVSEVDVSSPAVQAYIFKNVLQLRDYVVEAFGFSSVDPKRFFRLCKKCDFLVKLGTANTTVAITKHLQDENRKIFMLSMGTLPVACLSSSVPSYENQQNFSAVETDLLQRMQLLQHQEKEVGLPSSAGRNQNTLPKHAESSQFSMCKSNAPRIRGYPFQSETRTVNEQPRWSDGSEDAGIRIIRVEGAQPEPVLMQGSDDDECRSRLCEVCGAMFGDFLHLEYHRYAVHKNKVSIAFPICEECSYGCINEDSLRVHLGEFQPQNVLDN